MTNFGTTDVPLDGGVVLLSSGPLRHDVVPAETTAARVTAQSHR